MLYIELQIVLVCVKIAASETVLKVSLIFIFIPQLSAQKVSSIYYSEQLGHR